MKRFLLITFFGFMISLFVGCTKNSHKTPETFDYEQAAGIWVPYENTDEAGIIQSGPFTASSLFGIYAESVQLTVDKTFILVSWIDNNTFTLKTAETGTFECSLPNKLQFKGLYQFESDIIKFENDDL